MKNSFHHLSKLSSVFVLLLFCCLGIMPHTVIAAGTTKIEQQINLIDTEYSTTNTSASPTDNSLGLVLWEPNSYNNETVYFEAIIYCDTCTGGNQQAAATLYTDSGSSVSGGTVVTDQSSYQLVRSGDITSNLSSGEEYSVRLTVDATSGTAYLKAARLIILQDNDPITDTLTQVEIGNNTTTTSTSDTLITGPKIVLWDEDVHTDIDAVYFEATLSGSDGSATAYASLSNSSTCASTVSGSQVSITGTSWGRDRSSDISSNLTDDTDYWVCIRTTSGDTGYISNAKLIIEQSNTNGIDIIQTYHQYLNTLATDSDSTYTDQEYYNEFEPNNFEADIITYYFESTLQSSSGTGYARLYNSTDTSSITGSEVSHNAASFSRQRSQNLDGNLPTTTKDLDTQLRNGTTNTTTASSSWLVIQFDDVLDADLSFSVAGTLAGQVFNQITTSTSTSKSTLSFGNITVGEPKYISHMLTASTNAPSGYDVTLKLESFMQGLYPANNIDGFIAPWSAPTTWTEPTGMIDNQDTGWFGANTTDTRVTNWSSAAGLFGVVNSTPHSVMNSTSADSGTTAYVTYALEVNQLQPADLYSGSISYTILPTY